MNLSKEPLPWKKVWFKTGFIFGLLFLEQASLISSLFIVYTDHLREISLVHYLYCLPVMIISSIVLYDYFKLSNFQRKPVPIILYDSFMYVIVFISITCIFAYIFNLFALSRYALLLGSLIFYIFLSLWTMFNQRISLHLYDKVSLLILSESEEDAHKIMAKIKCEEKKLHLEIKGWLTPADALNDDEKFKCSTEVLISSIVEEKVKCDILFLCSKLNKVVYIVPSFYDLSFSKYRITRFYDTPTFQIENSGLTFQQQLLKRIFDILFSIMVLITTSPLLLIISILIKFDSKGPVFYTQERITYSGKAYKVYKFRTMIKDAEKIHGVFLSSQVDSRVTRVGKFLRSTHLDELPQFINVIFGSMSVVGPRPERQIIIDIIKEQLIGFDYRLKVKSGITGLAQLFGKYNTDPEDKLRYDIYYIKNYSLFFDLQLIILTIISIIRPNNYNKFKSRFDYFNESSDSR